MSNLTEVKEYTVQEEMVATLAEKVIKPYGYPITLLHDHERELLSEYVLEHDADNDNAVDAENNNTYDTFMLAKDAYKLIKKNVPELANSLIM